MKQAGISDYENERLNQLKSYNILDTLSEVEYEDIAYLASIIAGVPVALITFIDENRQWFKAHLGTPFTENERRLSFCTYAIDAPDNTMIVEDARADDRFKDNPVVVNDPKIVFYAGIPLVTEDGYGIGTLCVFDIKPRQMSAAQLKGLRILANKVMNLLEARKANYALKVIKLELETRNRDLQEFAMVVSHDIKSPVSNILLTTSLLKEEEIKSKEEIKKLLTITHNSAQQINKLVEGILDYYTKNNTADHAEKIDLQAFFKTLQQSITSPKDIVIRQDFVVESIYFNLAQLDQIFFNLLTNSIRYNDKSVVELHITARENDDCYLFSFSDNGIGIAAADYGKIFTLYSTLSSVDQFGIKSHGIGLATVKKIIEKADGNIEVVSEVGKGTTFNFNLAKILQEANQ
ncbi:ATP-binding protein [soil metagenome]